MSQSQSSTQKQIVVPPLCMPPQSFPQPCCPPPCFYPCFPQCCPPNPCYPQPYCPPPCPPPCCPPVSCCQPCCQSPCCPKVPSTPCCPQCPPQYCPSNPAKSRCNCCGGRSTLICVPRGSPPPHLHPSHPCPCRPQCGGDSGGDKSPPSFNNCNFYCSELPKSFSDNCQNGCPEEEDPCASQQPECCCPPGQVFEYDDGFIGSPAEAEGDDQLAPVPRGIPRKYDTSSRSKTRNGWNSNANSQTSRRAPQQSSSRRTGKGKRELVKKKQCLSENDQLENKNNDGVEEKPCSGNDNDDCDVYESMVPPPRPPRPRLGGQNSTDSNQSQFCCFLDNDDQRSDLCSPSMKDQHSYFTCYQTTATRTSNSFTKSSNPSILTQCRGPTITCNGKMRGIDAGIETTTMTTKIGGPLNLNAWTDGVSTIKSQTLESQKINVETVTMRTETIEKAITAPDPLQILRSDAGTTTAPLTVPLRNVVCENPHRYSLTLSGVEVRNQPRERIRKLSTDQNYKSSTAAAKTSRGPLNTRRKFKNPTIKMADNSLFQNGFRFNSNRLRDRDRRARLKDPGDLCDSSKETEMDKLLWSLIPTSDASQTPISTFSILSPPACPENASSDFISVPPTQPGSVNCQLLKIESSPVAAAVNDLCLFSQRRRSRSCDYKRKKLRGTERQGYRIGTACEFFYENTDDENDNEDLCIAQCPCQLKTCENSNEIKSNEREQTSVFCETLASILKKKSPLKCKGIDQVKFSRQDFCVMTCVVERRSSNNQKTCQPVKNCLYPQPVIIIPPTNSCQWRNYKFDSTPSSHLTGCSPCPYQHVVSNANSQSQHITTLPPIGKPRGQVKSPKRCSNFSCLPPCPISPCPRPCSVFHPCAPYCCTPVRSPPCFKNKPFRSPTWEVAGLPSPDLWTQPSPSQSKLFGPDLSPPTAETTRTGKSPPRPPPRLPPRKRHPPPKIEVRTTPSAVSISSISSSSKSLSISSGSRSPKVGPIPEAGFPPSLQSPPLPPKVGPIPEAGFPPSLQSPPLPPKVGPIPVVENPPPSALPPDLIKIPPYSYGMKYPPKVPPLILPPISHRTSSVQSIESSRTPPSSDPPVKTWVNRPPSKKYFEFIPPLPYDDSRRDPRKTKKARRRFQRPKDVNSNLKNLPIRKNCCDPDCCEDPDSCQNLESELNPCCANQC